MRFRDFRTSPLTYTGIGFFAQLSYLKTSDRNESEFGIFYQTGTYSNTFNDQSSSAKVHTVSLFYGNMYRLNSLSSERWNTKIGGLFNATGPFMHSFLKNGQIGYIRFNEFTEMVGDEHLDIILNRFDTTEGLIIDIRENSGGVPSDIFKILSRFLAESIFCKGLAIVMGWCGSFG